MSNAWSEPACCKRQRISISSLTDTSYEGHEAVPPRSLDELTDAACDCLEQYRERSMQDKLERTLVDKAVQQDNSSRLQALVARFEKAIQAHDARLAASTAALAALSEISGTAREAPALRHDHTAPLAAPSEISIPAFPTSYTLARNAPALRHEHTSALPL